MRSPSVFITLFPEQRHILEAWLRAPTAPQSIVMRAKIVLLTADDELTNTSMAQRLHVSRPTVILWQQRFAAGGLDALTKIAPGRGRKPTISAAEVEEIVNATRQTTPPAATHWSCRTMAKAQGVSPATIGRIWRAHGLQPHRIETFKLSTDPRLSRSCAMWLGCISIHLSMPWYCAWTRRARSRRWTAPNPGSR